MSLTSYRAAPPRATGVCVRFGLNPTGAGVCVDRLVRIVLGWPGDDLLSRALRHSTIGAEEFNGRVRDGIGFGRLAQATGPAKNNGKDESPQRRSSAWSCWSSFVLDEQVRWSASDAGSVGRGHGS